MSKLDEALVRVRRDEEPEHELTCEGCGHKVTASCEVDLCDCPKCGRDCLSAEQQKREEGANER